MDRDDQNRTEMFSTVDSLMGGNKSIWGGVPAINETTGDLKVIIADMGKSIRKQATATGRAGETDTLPVEIGNTTSLLRNRLDKQMTRYKKTQPESYAGDRSARVIVDRGGSGGGAPTPPTPPPN